MSCDRQVICRLASHTTPVLRCFSREIMGPFQQLRMRGIIPTLSTYRWLTGSAEELPNHSRCVAYIARAGADHRSLVIAGGQFKSFSDEGILDQMNATTDVHVLGRCTDDELSCLYSGCAAFVFASVYEGFGMPPLEAQACGAPVICSNRPAMPEILGPHAAYFDPDSASELARLMGEHLRPGQQGYSPREARDGVYRWADAAQNIADVASRLEKMPNEIA
jgi:glycosyltransferase involved in cell wall biosynthesis